MQPGFFDHEDRLAKLEKLEKLEKLGDPLPRLDSIVDWDAFRPLLKIIHHKQRKSNAGRKPHDVTLMFKMLVLQALYNLSDDQTEYQVRDRLSFQRFLGLSPEDTVPDAKTLWLFREQLVRHGLIEKLFGRFDEQLWQSGLMPKGGQIIDASLVNVPKNRNTRDENKQIKEGRTPDGWDDEPTMKRQKDEDARWTKKHGRSHYGYKNHINIDKEHKLIRRYAVTDASVHDSQVFDELLDEENSDHRIWARLGLPLRGARATAARAGLQEPYSPQGHQPPGAEQARAGNQPSSLEDPRPRRACLRRPAHPPGQYPGTYQGQDSGSDEDRVDESDLQHATAGVLAQAAMRLLYGLSER
jgi:transposase, IS5 family